MSEEFINWYEDNIEEIVTRYESEYPEVVANNGYWEDYINETDLIEFAKKIYNES